MTNKSISFNEEMLKAILDGRKKQTRRPHAEPKYKAGDVVRISNTERYIHITRMWKEKLQDITGCDAISEGFNLTPYDIAEEDKSWSPFINWFIGVWDSIYGKDESKCWNANPWVWVYEFEVLNEN